MFIRFAEPIRHRMWSKAPDESVPTAETQASYERSGVLAPWEREAIAQVATERRAVK